MKKKYFFYISGLILICLQLWFSFVTFSSPFIGIELVQDQNKHWIINKLDSESNSLQLNVQRGDTILKINDDLPHLHKTVQKWHSIEQAQNITILRDGNEFNVNLEDDNASTSTSILPFCGEVLAILFSVLIFKKAGHTNSARLLALVFLNIGLTFSSVGASIRGDSLGKFFIIMFMMLLPIVFLHFLFAFLKERTQIQLSNHYVKYLYIIFGCISLLALPYFTPKYSYYFYQFSNQVVATSFSIGLLISFFFLIFAFFKYRKEKPYLSIIIKTVWSALTISFFPFICLSIVPQTFFGGHWVNSLYTSWLVLFFPLSFAYLILAKKLYDIDLVLRRILLNVALSIIPSTILVVGHTLILQHHVTLQHVLFSFIFTVITITFILYSFEYFTTKLEFIIFPRKYYLNRAMKKIANNLCSISSFRELKDMVLVDIVNTLQVFGAAIVYKYQDRIETVTEGQISLPVIEGSADVEAWNYPALLRFEINRHEEYTSYLIMTDKKTNTALSKEDMQWLNFIISYLAVSLENMHLIHKLNMRLQQLASQMPSEQSAQELVWFRKLMFELQEDERRRIATDLHDTTMQDLFFLKKRFASLIEKPEFPQQDIEHMKGILDYVEIINTNLRQNCFELHPHLLHEIGLINTLRKLVEHETPICPFQLEFMAQGAERIEDRDLDAKRHVFRIVQELLNNAKKHSLASIVSITLTAEGNNFLLVYKDDGIGLQAQSETSREIGSSGTGLEQMRSRILSLNGHLNIRKDMESGVYLSVTIPMRKVA